MGENKTFEFHGTPGQYFVVFLVTMISAYIPIFGWPFGFNYGNEWIARNLTINGRKVKYHAAYGETLKFLLVNLLLIIITFGIYSFWYLPKQYRYILAHAGYEDEMGTATAIPQISAPVNPVMPDASAPNTIAPSSPIIGSEAPQAFAQIGRAHV